MQRPLSLPRVKDARIGGDILENLSADCRPTAGTADLGPDIFNSGRSNDVVLVVAPDDFERCESCSRSISTSARSCAGLCTAAARHGSSRSGEA